MRFECYVLCLEYGNPSVFRIIGAYAERKHAIEGAKALERATGRTHTVYRCGEDTPFGGFSTRIFDSATGEEKPE